MTDYSWHAHETDDALGRLESDRSGLSDEEADRRLARVGPNRLMRSLPVSAWKILGDQLTSVVVYLLAAAGAISLFLADYVEAAAIAAVLGLNTAIGFVTELRARRAMEALLQFDVPRAVVLRSGHIRLVEAHVLVPGDIIELSAGQAVPADARLVSATDLRATEAALTGESLPSAKQDDVTLDPDTPLAERANMVYKGTTIAAGIGRAVVTATGPSTELGRIGALVAGVPEERHATRAPARRARTPSRVAGTWRGGGRRGTGSAPRRLPRTGDRNRPRACRRRRAGSAAGRRHHRAGGRRPADGETARAGPAICRQSKRWDRRRSSAPTKRGR